MIHTMDTTKVDMAPQQNQTWFAALYFVIFIFIGSIMITQLFVAVIIQSYAMTQDPTYATNSTVDLKIAMP